MHRFSGIGVFNTALGAIFSLVLFFHYFITHMEYACSPSYADAVFELSVWYGIFFLALLIWLAANHKLFHSLSPRYLFSFRLPYALLILSSFFSPPVCLVLWLAQETGG